MTLTYISLGGNIGDSASILENAISRIKMINGVHGVKQSRFYRTTPVSDIPQNDYVNAICSFNSTLGAKVLLKELQNIETSLGKIRKEKNAPRAIDLDILFFGEESYNEPELIIPHPRWHERLFVLVPLSDITKVIMMPGPLGAKSINIGEYLKTFANPNNEVVTLLE